MMTVKWIHRIAKKKAKLSRESELAAMHDVHDVLRVSANRGSGHVYRKI